MHALGGSSTDRARTKVTFSSALARLSLPTIADGNAHKGPTAPQSPHKGARTTTAQLLFSLSSPLYTAQQLLLASKRPTATGPKTWWSSETVWIQKRKKVAGSFSPAAETRLFPHLLPKHQSSSPLPMRRCRSREGWWEKKKNGDTIFWQHPGVDSCFHAESGWKNSGNWYTQLWCCYLYKTNLTERDRFNARWSVRMRTRTLCKCLPKNNSHEA